jgi:hypothetical protein
MTASMKAQSVSEEQRSGVYGMLRVSINTFVAVVLLLVKTGTILLFSSRTGCFTDIDSR